MSWIDILYLVLGIYILIILVIFFMQRKLLYHPTINNYLNEKDLNHKIEKILIKSENNLIGWYFKKNKKFKTLLFFHGNAGSIDNRVYKLNGLSKLDINYLIVAYRGFSGNKGNPNEAGLYIDSEAAKKWLNENNIKDSQIILYGESLGTAVAINLCQNYKFAGIILEAPFTSMSKLAKKYYPFLPVKFLLKDKYESLEKLPNIKSPILVMHGKKDKIVPFDMGLKVFERANEPKYNYFNNYDDHMMEFNNELLKSIETFIKGLN